MWFLTNQDRVGRLAPDVKTPTVYSNPLHCAVGEDDCNLRGIAVLGGSLWLPDANNGLRRIDAKTGRVANQPNDDRYSSAPVVGSGRLWFTDVDRTLAVDPPATGVVSRVTVPGAYAEALAPSTHGLWIAGSGSTRGAPAAVARVDARGRLTGRVTLPVPDEVSPIVAAVDEHTAYVVVTPASSPPVAPAQLFEVTIGPAGHPVVHDLGALPFGPGGIVVFGGHVWMNDVNAPRIVELDRSGRLIGDVPLDGPADGQLVGAAGRLWYVGDTSAGSSELDVIDPQTRAVTSTTPIPLPGEDHVAEFTVAATK